MKSKIQVVIAAILIISSFSACDDTVGVNDDNHSLINYTDTGDKASSLNSRTAGIDHELPSSDLVSSSVLDSSEKPEKRTVSGNVQSGTSNEKTQSFVSINDDSDTSVRKPDSSNDDTVNIITYYYENEEVPTNPDVTSETGHHEDDPNDTDTDNGTEFSSDSDITSSIHEQLENPIAVGFFSEDDLAFSHNGGKIFLGENIKDAADILGQPKAVDSNSYNYDDFWILIKQDENEEEFVEEIQIFSNTIVTEKGIRIGMSGEDVVNTYGSSSTVVNDEYRYYIGNTYMYFYIPNGTVANMGYRIDREVDAETE